LKLLRPTCVGIKDDEKRSRSPFFVVADRSRHFAAAGHDAGGTVPVSKFCHVARLPVVVFRSSCCSDFEKG
jgi:hypothetical protein